MQTLAIVFALLAFASVAVAQECSSIKNMQRCAARPDCKWTGVGNEGACADRQTWTPSDDRLRPPSGCRAVHTQAGCATWEYCKWDSKKKMCLDNSPPATPKPTTKKPTPPTPVKPTNKPTTAKPTQQPTDSPVAYVKCASFKGKNSCVKATNVEPPGCYWNGKVCLPKKA